MRHLAIDFGLRRVGLALSDEGGRFATPHEVLQVTDPQQAIEPIIRLIAKEHIAQIIIGLPLNMDGSIGAQARQVAQWSRQLHQQADVPIVFVDERLSSFDAQQQLNSRRRSGEKLTHKKKKQQLDAIAAARFLQEYLDGKLSSLVMNKDEQRH
ncbi:MAG: Holliday junction resolvase RuvX [Phycisphaerales bacterium]|nr:Holliday junction resolvase RuvX [Phycisphaerales bacterium]